MKKGIVLLIASIVLIMYFFVANNPALLIRKSSDNNVAQTIVDHRLAKLHTSYYHNGKPEVVVTKIWTEQSTNLFSNVYWCKVVDKEQESKKSFWHKFSDKIVSLIRFMAFDERGAFVLTERKYDVNNEVLSGEYIYLGILRLTIHIEGQGTGVWEFPGYVDRSMPFEKLNSIMKLKERDMIEIVRQLMYSSVTPEQSYKVQQVERGATRRESWQPWVSMSCDVTLEYIGSGINAK